MIQWFVYGMIYLGSALMVYNIYRFTRYAHYVRDIRLPESSNRLVILPIALLVLFLIGYLIIGFVGKPDLVVAGILFGGSVFVYVMAVLLTGITQRIVESQRMEAEYLAAERSSQAKAAFLATISHEMRTPMNVILGLDGLALQDPDLSDDTRRRLEKIGRSGRHLLGLINNVLDMNRMESGGISISPAPFMLGDALEQISAIANTLCEQKGLDYRAVTAGDVCGWFMGDQFQLQRALMCILDNAVQYTDAPGMVRFAVNCAPAGEKAQLTFTVEDTGVGIDEEFLPRVFDLFSQADSSYTTPFGGTGLGLSICKNIIDAMGGTVAVASKKGVGSTFTVTLTLPSAEAPSPPGASEISLAGRRVLIVEDLPDNAEIVADLLDLEDATTEHAENGRVAVEMVKNSGEGYYDAILMDLRMPEMDGLTATRYIRELDRGDVKTLPIIALTANATEADVRNSLDAGMNAHLAKPTDAGLLYQTIKQCIGNTNAGRAERHD